MAKKSRERPRPTDAELEILRTLWSQGPASVRRVHDVLNAGRDDGPGYTTVLKTMQIMMGKGLVERDETQRPQVYRPADRQHETQRRLLRDLVNRAFGGSHRQLVLQALADRKATPAELQAIEALLDRMEEKPK